MCRALPLIVLMLGLLTALAGPLSAEDKWEVANIGRVDYVRLRDVWKFYHFTPKKGRPGCVSYGAGNRVVSVRPSRQDFYVNNYRYILSYPVREHDGELMISAIDMKKLVDPVLRPRYSPAAGAVRAVVIDPGHGGHDAGAVSPYAREKDCNLAVGLKLRKRLEKAGFKVVMTRSNDTFLTLRQRVEIANRTPDSIFVSIHHNSSGRPSASGIETFTLAPHGTTSPFARTRRTEELAGNNQDSENIALATAVHSRAIKKSGALDRGIQRARFSVLCTTQRPAILFEGGFVTHGEEGRKISSDEYQNMLADSICDGIINYSQIIGGHQNTLRRRTVSPSGSAGTRIHGSNTYRGTTRL